MRRTWWAVALSHVMMLAGMARATPSSNFWAPSAASVQPHGVLHVTYDTYFHEASSYPVDAGLGIGVLPSKKLQLEIGFDLLYPTFTGGKPLGLPLLLNAKLGSAEEAMFRGSPAWSAGIYSLGFEQGVTDYNALYALLGKTVPRVGSLSVGGYHGLSEDLFRSSDGSLRQSGFIAGWFSPAIDVPKLDRLHLTWDLQTGRNVLGATGGGIYLYFTPAIDLATGPVFFFDKALQPGGVSWMWSMQLDVDLDLLSR